MVVHFGVKTWKALFSVFLEENNKIRAQTSPFENILIKKYYIRKKHRKLAKIT